MSRLSSRKCTSAGRENSEKRNHRHFGTPPLMGDENGVAGRWPTVKNRNRPVSGKPTFLARLFSEWRTIHPECALQQQADDLIEEDYGRYRYVFRPRRGSESIRRGPSHLAELLEDLVVRDGPAEHGGTDGASRAAFYFMLTRTVLAVLPSTVSTTSTSPRPIRLRGTRRFT